MPHTTYLQRPQPVCVSVYLSVCLSFAFCVVVTANVFSNKYMYVVRTMNALWAVDFIVSLLPVPSHTAPLARARPLSAYWGSTFELLWPRTSSSVHQYKICLAFQFLLISLLLYFSFIYLLICWCLHSRVNKFVRLAYLCKFRVHWINNIVYCVLKGFMVNGNSKYHFTSI